MAFSFGTPNTQNSTSTAATKPTFSFGVGATTTSTSGFGGFGTPATSTGFGSSGAPATTTAAPLGALGATPASTARFSFGGIGSGANAAEPRTAAPLGALGATPASTARFSFGGIGSGANAAEPRTAAPLGALGATPASTARFSFGGTGSGANAAEPRTAAPLGALGATPASTARFSFGGTGSGANAAEPRTAAPLGALGATPASTARFSFGGTGSGANAAEPRTGFGSTSFGTIPTFGVSTFGRAAPILDSAAPTFDTNTLGGTNTSGTRTSTEFTGFGNNLGSAPQFGQMKCDIRCQSEQEIQRAADELAEMRLNAYPPTLLQVVAQREVVDHVESALSPEEVAAWVHVTDLTSQRAAPPAPLDNDPDLGNHPNVEVFRNVRGVEKNIYFFTHDYREQNQNDNNSFANHKEADMTLALANYLIQQGYTADDITILAAYSAQMLYMTKERQKYVSLSHVKITAIDNYQGEESKIILLSLVRNNEENIIGFLDTDNRVCVALSRAKEGLYIFGNINMMKTAKSGLWTKIATTLENNGCLGTNLILKCQYHPIWDTTCITAAASKRGIDGRTCKCGPRRSEAHISTAERFLRMPLRDQCLRLCHYQYDCGHKCQFFCHLSDREHIINKCTMKCERVLCELGHVCPLKCCEDCEPCQVLVRKTLPCGHEIDTVCHRDVEDPPSKCLIKVDITFPVCKHKGQKLCYQDINDLYEVHCTTPCEYRLKCGHVCGRNCHVIYDYYDDDEYDDDDHYDDDNGDDDVVDDDADDDDADDDDADDAVDGDAADDDDLKHENLKCKRPCECRLECGHVCRRKCHVTDDPNHKKYKCRKPCARPKAGCVADLLGDRGDHQCRKLCCEKCDDCDAQVEKVIPECLHTINLQCKQSPSHELCNEECERLLSCGHPCLDRCGAACDPTKCTEPSLDEVWSPCGHKVRPPCDVSALFAKGEVQWEKFPQYCNTPCGATLACKHLCAGSCFDCSQGRLHQPCTQQCNQENICGHQCQEPCNQICPPCKMPCKVKCVHSRCTKLCGEPCTPCQEPCSRACVHGACSRRCGEPCDRAPCSEQCARLRPCGHRCRGLCGEPCPDICQRCRPVEFPKDFLGDPYEDTAKFIVLQDCDHVLEVDSMDCLMMGDQENIQIRKCPFCRKAIINTNRYKDNVNKMFKDINPIKLRVYGTQQEIKIKLTELQREVDRFTGKYGDLGGYMKDMFLNFTSLLKTQKNVSLLEVEMECVYFNIFEMIIECWKTYLNKTHPKLLYDELNKLTFNILSMLKIKPKSRIPIKISEQQQNDVGNEIKRLNVIVQLSTLLHHAISTTDEHVTQQVETTKAVVFSLTVFNEDLALESLKQLQKMIKISAPVTKYERELIVKAIGLKAGHWYKCPNGHFYCIGECGGAMALGRCPEAGCGAAIGGAQHTLTAGNSHAPEMDGSRFAAWSEQGNNMANFALDNII